MLPTIPNPVQRISMFIRDLNSELISGSAWRHMDATGDRAWPIQKNETPVALTTTKSATANRKRTFVGKTNVYCLLIMMEVAMTANQKPTIVRRFRPAGRASIFGSIPLLEGEDPNAYDELLARVSSRVKPSDILEENWVSDVVNDTWDARRWRRLRASLLAAKVPDALESVLGPIFQTDCTDDGEIIRARDGCSYDPGDPVSPEEELAIRWAADDPVAIERVEKLLKLAGLTMDAVVARALVRELDSIERLDRLISTAEGRRDAALREIERHRSGFGQALRDATQGIDAEFETVEPKAIAPKTATARPVRTQHD